MANRRGTSRVALAVGAGVSDVQHAELFLALQYNQKSYPFFFVPLFQFKIIIKMNMLTRASNEIGLMGRHPPPPVVYFCGVRL